MRWIYELSGHSVPIDSLEEFVLHDVTDLQANAWVGDKNLADEVARHRVQILRQNYASGLHELDHLLRRHRREATSRATVDECTLSDSNLYRFRSERREAAQNLADQDPEAPYVRLIVVASSYKNLWRRVGWRAAVGSHSVFPDVFQLLAEAKVDQLYVPGSIQENILGLQVSVNDIPLM